MFLVSLKAGNNLFSLNKHTHTQNPLNKTLMATKCRKLTRVLEVFGRTEKVAFVLTTLPGLLGLSWEAEGCLGALERQRFGSLSCEGAGLCARGQ